MKRLKVSNNTAQDTRNILDQVYYPLGGFLREVDYYSVLRNMRLLNGAVWTIPIVLDVDEETARGIEEGRDILLENSFGEEIAILKRVEVYGYNKLELGKYIFGTDCKDHPGVISTLGKSKFFLGGELEGLGVPLDTNDNHFYTPKRMKELFKKNAWQKVVAFQTRNVPHKSHEYLQRKALANVDGLLVQPVIGEKKEGDFKDEVIIEAYKILFKNYYDEDEAMLSTLPIKMHYAGPREAVMHALIRRNFGCSHMIIGRDHAGVGDYYGTYEAQNIFDNFSKADLGIEILKYENVGHCYGCDSLVEEARCNHGTEDRFHLSGTKIRDMIKNKKKLPNELLRSEVAEYLLGHPSPFV